MENFTQTELVQLIDTFAEVSNYNFSEYSKKSFARRVEKILSDNNLSISSLIKKITKDEKFLEKIAREITVNTTELFRDPNVWQLFKSDIMPSFQDYKSIRILHAGASIGLEVYSMIILMNELGLLPVTDFYASDINEKVLDVARIGKYKFREVDEFTTNFNKVINDDEQTPIVPFSKYFDVYRNKHTISIKPSFTSIPVFKKQNLVTESNVFNQKFDIIFCRNVLIYFNHELQNKVIHSFYKLLNTNGVLIIGRHEGLLGPIASRFIKKDTIYIKK